MCVVLVCPPKIRPSLETLRLCERANPHGGGIAWRRNGAVEWMKTNDLAELNRIALKAKGEIVIHFRVASVGGVCNELRHPFPITPRAHLHDHGQAIAVLFQNGTWLGYRQALESARGKGHEIPDGPMSDTRAAAFLCSIHGHKFLKECGPSRWVYFSAAETALYGQWCKRDGILFSNLYWQPKQAEQARTPQIVSQVQPVASRAVDKSKSDLWDLDPVSEYWSKLAQSCPKPSKRR